MQTLQATKPPAMLRIIEHSLFDRPTQYRIIDEEGVMIAKVNGKACLPIAEKMIEAENKLVELQTFCRNRLIEILQHIAGTGEMSVVIRAAANNAKLQEEAIKTLKEQLRVAPRELLEMIGYEAVFILNLLNL